MSTLDKIIYIADYIEPGRNKAADLPRVRKLAFEDLDTCMAEILCDTLKYRSRVGGPLDPSTQLAYEFYRQYQKKQTDPV
jgi:HD superfamily phosphohydrolase YqeK